MRTTSVEASIANALADRRLLAHPFYRRWEAGGVTMDELADYAAQYRHFEAALPKFLARLGAALPPGSARDLVAANLADELGDPVPHIALLERFASALGAPPAPPSVAMNALLDCYERLLDESSSAGLAGFVAYESQAAEVAASKADGLRRHYGLSDEGVSFWEHHAEVDAHHGAWLMAALAQDAADTADNDLGSAARAAADAWWRFLDEREALKAA